ncbi:MAG: hypothetical protein FD130_368, partial [Halothiobacillaceae bacterium]
MVKTLAAFILRGPLQAIGVALLSGLLAFVVPPLTIVTGGVVALVTLRNGAKAGLIVVAGTAGVLAVLAYAALSELSQLLTYLTSLVLAVIPVWGLAWVLRTTVSLSKTVLVA